MALSIVDQGVVNTTTAFNQSADRILVLPNGNYYVTWMSMDGIDAATGQLTQSYRGQQFTEAGVKAGGEVIFQAGLDLSTHPVVAAALTNGKIAIYAHDIVNDGTTYTGISKIEIFNANGTSTGHVVNDFTGALPLPPIIDKIIALPGGGFLTHSIGNFGVSDWQVHGSDGAVLRQDFFAQGSWSETDANLTLTVLSDGHILASKGLETPGFGIDITTQLFNADGTADGDARSFSGFAVYSGGAHKVTALADGNYLVTWDINRPNVGSQHVGQIFAADGTAVGKNIGFYSASNSRTALDFYGTPANAPEVAALPDGRFVFFVSYHKTSAYPAPYGTTTTGAFAQIYSPDGVPEGNQMTLSPATYAVLKNGHIEMVMNKILNAAHENDVTHTDLNPGGALHLVSKLIGITGGNGNDVLDVAGEVMNVDVVLSNGGASAINGIKLSEETSGLNVTGLSLAAGQVKTYHLSHTLTQAEIDNMPIFRATTDLIFTSLAEGNGTARVSDATSVTITKTFTADDKVKLLSVSGGNGNAALDAVGDVFTYQLTLTNTSNQNFHNLRFFQNPSYTPSIDLARGETATITLTDTLTQLQYDYAKAHGSDIPLYFLSAGTGSVGTDSTGNFTLVPTGDQALQLASYKMQPTMTIDSVTGGNNNGIIDHAGDEVVVAVRIANTGTAPLTGVTIDEIVTGFHRGNITIDAGKTKTVAMTYTLTQTDFDSFGIEQLNANLIKPLYFNVKSDQVNDLSLPTLSISATRLSHYTSEITVGAVTGGNENGIADVAGDVLNYMAKVTNDGNLTLTEVGLFVPGTAEAITAPLILAPDQVKTLQGSYVLTEADIASQGGGDGIVSLGATLSGTSALNGALSKDINLGFALSGAVAEGSAASEMIFGEAGDNTINGNGGNDMLSGGKGVDHLNGGAGRDQLTGGAGKDVLDGGDASDRFIYNAKSEGGDQVTNFDKADYFVFKGANFGHHRAGKLNATEFIARTDNKAQDSNDHFIFRTTDDTLWFDADGKAGQAATKIADLSNDFALKAGDILIV